MKKVFIFLALFIQCNMCIMANDRSNLETISIVQPKKDVLVWKYKSINGYLHKRLYNQTKGKWEGEWIKC